MEIRSAEKMLEISMFYSFQIHALGKAVHLSWRARPKSQLHLLSQGDLTFKWKVKSTLCLGLRQGLSELI